MIKFRDLFEDRKLADEGIYAKDENSGSKIPLGF